MSRHAVRKVIVVALIFALAAPSVAVFGQDFPGGGRGYGGGRGGGRSRFRQMFPNGFPPMVPAQPTPEVKPEDPKKDESKDKDKKDVPKLPVGPPPIVRQPAMENAGMLSDQKMRVDDKKLVSFNFQEAPWNFVLDELARVSNMTLDWQTLPGDSLNLRSSGKYPVAQARDTVNAQLLSRGYSMLVDNKAQTITVVNLDNLNTALVPRVSPEDLENLAPHDLVKVSFHLDWLTADKVVDEFKQMLSPKGKLLPMKATNRLEAIDAVENLKELATLLDQEQNGKGEHAVREFELRYTRAAEVVDQLESFMGLKKDESKQAANPQGQPMMGMPMQMQPGMQPQAAQPAQPQKPEIRFLALQRHNSVLVNAPPDQMAIIRSAIFRIDVPSERQSLSENAQLVKNYRLATLDPEALINMLESVGDLDPQTKLEADKKNRTVIAYASPRDHKAIGAIVQNLDGTDRELHVIKLRKLDADMVAGTIRALLVGDDKNANNNNNGNSFGFGRRWGFGGFGSTNTQEEQPSSKFRVEADVVANRLLVFSNKIELEQVEKCLAQLGEVARREGSPETLRVLDFGGAEDEQQLLERLRRAWPALGKDGNKLIIDVPKPEKAAPPRSDESTKEPAAPKKAAPEAPSASNSDPGVAAPANGKLPVRFTDLEHVTQLAADNQNQDPRQAGPSAGARPQSLKNGPPRRRGMRRWPPEAVSAPEPSDKAAPAEASVPGDPIYITRGTDGKLVISSRDTKALDQLEEIMTRMAPPRKDFEVFYLQYAAASSMRYTLDDFFSVEKKESSSDQRMRRFWFDDSSDNKKDEVPRLSQRRPLKFIDDDATNSILVQGGTADQLRRIGDIIKLYDRPEKPNTRASRITQSFQIKHNKASIVAEMIKELYKDLLSANDKALESYNQSKNQGNRGGRFATVFDFGDKEDNSKLNQGRFKGYLSLAADDSTNSLLVSCPSALMGNIEQTVHYLDQAAVPTAQSFQVIKIDNGIDASVLQKKLSDMLKPSAPKSDAKPAEQQNPMQGRGGRSGGRGGRGGQAQGMGEGGGGGGGE
jgi:hypothetical protein